MVEKADCPQQETHIVNMVIENNCIRLRELQDHITANYTIFQNVSGVSPSPKLSPCETTET